MKLSEIQAKKAEYYCQDCKQELDVRQVAYHEKFGHKVVKTGTSSRSVGKAHKAQIKERRKVNEKHN